MKKIIYMSIILLINIFLIQTKVNANEQDSSIFKILQAENKQCEIIWYLQKDNQFYVSIGYDNTPECYLYKYENKKLVKIPIALQEGYEFKKKYEILRIDNPIIKKHDLGNNKYLILKQVGESYTNYFLTIEENGKEKDISKNRYVLFAWGDYVYIDKEFQKIYMFCEDRKKNIIGIFIYDIKKDLFQEMHIKDSGDEKTILYSNPIRVPNTPYLMFMGVKASTDWGMYIEEIPEWKSELEQQEKNKKENPQAKTAYTNGTANIRDNPKGKIISTLNDWTEVLILEQKDDWYHILYADINGWTYKDNIRQVEK